MKRTDISVDEGLMLKKWVIFSGGIDMAGYPILTFPAEDHSSSWTADGLLRLLLYMTDIVELVMKRKSVAFLVDFQRGVTEEKMSLLVQTLQKLEMEKQGVVAVLFVLQPKSRGKCQTLKKLLGIKRRRHHVTFVSKFKTILLKSIAALHTQAEPAQLTRDFGGTISYDHHSWIFFHKKILPILAMMEDVLERSIDTKDKVLLLRDYDTGGHSHKQLRKHRVEVYEKFTELISASHIRPCVQRSKQALHLLDQHTENDPLGHLHHVLIMEVTTHMRTMYGQLTQSQKELDTIWQDLDNALKKRIVSKQNEDKADKLCLEISEKYWPHVVRHPSIATCLRQAEIYRTHFTATLYEPAKALLKQATEILQHIHSAQKDYGLDNGDVKDIVSKLTNTVHPFAKQLNEINHVYMAVHVFHFLFRKSLVWYQKALDFVPISLCTSSLENNARTPFIPAPSGWKNAVRIFLEKHPPPREDHISGIDLNAPKEIDVSSRANAEEIAKRLRVLISIMYDNYIDIESMQNIYKWKTESSFTKEIHDDYQDNISSGLSPKSHKHSKTQFQSRLRRRITRSRSIHKQQNKTYLRLGCDGKLRCVRNASPGRDNDHHGLPVIPGQAQIEDDVFIRSFGGFNFGQREGMRLNRSFRSSSSLFSSGNWSAKTDSMVDYIQRVTSSPRLSNDQKVQYVSEFLQAMEEDEASLGFYHEDFNDNRDIFGKPQHLPVEKISDMNHRLCKSLDDILGSEQKDTGLQFDVRRKSEAKSMTSLNSTAAETNLWRKIESRSVSLKSLRNEDIERSSRSNDSTDDLDDSAPLDSLQRNRPARQNIRRKRRNTTDLNGVEGDMFREIDTICRRNSERMQHQMQQNNSQVDDSLVSHIKSMKNTASPLVPKKSIWSLSSDMGYDSTVDNSVRCENPVFPVTFDSIKWKNPECAITCDSVECEKSECPIAYDSTKVETHTFCQNQESNV